MIWSPHAETLRATEAKTSAALMSIGMPKDSEQIFVEKYGDDQGHDIVPKPFTTKVVDGRGSRKVTEAAWLLNSVEQERQRDRPSSDDGSATRCR